MRRGDRCAGAAETAAGRRPAGPTRSAGELAARAVGRTLVRHRPVLPRRVRATGARGPHLAGHRRDRDGGGRGARHRVRAACGQRSRARRGDDVARGRPRPGAATRGGVAGARGGDRCLATRRTRCGARPHRLAGDRAPGARRGARPAARRLRDRGARTRRHARAGAGARDPAGHPPAGIDRTHARRGRRTAPRGGPLVSRHRRAPADAHVGEHDPRGAPAPRAGTVAAAGPGHRPGHRDCRRNPARRRPSPHRIAGDRA